MRRFHVPAAHVDERLHTALHLLFWQVRGESSFVLDGSELRLVMGRALWVPAGVRHSIDIAAESVLLPLAFEVSHTATTLDVPAIIGVDRDLRTLLLAYVQNEISIIRPIVDLGRQILAALEEQGAAASDLVLPRQTAARAVAETLRFNPGDDRTVDELAASVHASTRTIERAFRADTGMTLREWRMRIRIEAAQVLLRADTSLAAVALRVGYTSASAFHRVFKAQTGTTPTEYARQFRPEP